MKNCRCPKYVDDIQNRWFQGNCMASSERVLVVNLNDSPDYQKLLDGEPQTQGMRAGRVY
jgi:hypothetical protein